MIPKRPAPDFVPGWTLVFGKDHAQTNESMGEPEVPARFAVPAPFALRFIKMGPRQPQPSLKPYSGMLPNVPVLSQFRKRAISLGTNMPGQHFRRTRAHS